MNAIDNLRFPRPTDGASPMVARIGHHIWEKLWVESLARSWSSLALVPACRNGCAAFAAEPLAEVGRLALAGGVRAVQSERMSLADCRTLIESLEAGRRTGQRTVVSVDAPLASQAGLLIARSADAAILLVTLGVAEISAARETLAAVGRERFVGALLINGGRP